MSSVDVLAIVADQFETLSKRLDTQLTRTGQLQQELDGLRRALGDVRQQLQQTRELLTQALAVGSEA